MIYNLLVVGAGELGSRHLQALGKLEFNKNIYVFDPDRNSLERALQRYADFNGSDASLPIFIEDFSQLPNSIDLAIISTSSIVRLKMMNDLLLMKRVKYLILEKLLFNKLNDYQAASQIIQQSGVKAWVNCPQRMYPFFMNLKSRFALSLKDIKITITGSRWGLASNAIHNLDIAAFLWGSDLSYNFHFQRVIESKREGYRELSGTLEASANDGGSLTQVCHFDGHAPFCFHIFHPECCILWDWTNSFFIESSLENGWKWTNLDVKVPYQSELTTQIVNDLIRTGECLLPDYDSNSELHTKMLNTFQKELIKQNLQIGEHLFFT